jgi:hypothetical protein
MGCRAAVSGSLGTGARWGEVLGRAAALPRPMANWSARLLFPKNRVRFNSYLKIFCYGLQLESWCKCPCKWAHVKCAQFGIFLIEGAGINTLLRLNVIMS